MSEVLRTYINLQLLKGITGLELDSDPRVPIREALAGFRKLRANQFRILTTITVTVIRINTDCKF